MRKKKISAEGLVVVNNKRIAPIGAEVLRVFQKYDASEVEALVVLKELSELITKHSGVRLTGASPLDISKN